VKITWRILGVAGFNFAWVKRQWMWIIQSLMFTLSIVLIAYGWGGYAIAKTVIPIFMVVSAWEFGLNIITQEVGWHRVSREWERIIASPLTLLEYFTGLVIGMLPMELASLIPLSIIAVTSGFEIHVVLLPLILTPLAMALGAFFLPLNSSTGEEPDEYISYNKSINYSHSISTTSTILHYNTTRAFENN